MGECWGWIYSRGREPEAGKERKGRKVGLCLQFLTEENKGNTFPVGKNQCCSNRKCLQEHSRNLLELHGIFVASWMGGSLSLLVYP